MVSGGMDVVVVAGIVVHTVAAVRRRCDRRLVPHDGRDGRDGRGLQGHDRERGQGASAPETVALNAGVVVKGVAAERGSE